MLEISVKPPSAVCTIEIPSLAFRVAWLVDRIWDFKFSEIAKPAASSADFVMRLPPAICAIDFWIVFALQHCRATHSWVHE